MSRPFVHASRSHCDSTAASVCWRPRPFQGADLHAAILAGGAGDDFLTGGVEFVLGLWVVGACMAAEDADSSNAVQRDVGIQAGRTVVVALVQLRQRLAFADGIAGDEVQGGPGRLRQS